MKVRKACYEHRYCTSQTASRPVLVIGNRVVGGTGKTPVILGLVSLLEAQGLSVGIVSRGYGRTEKAPRLVHKHDAIELVGDEPRLLAHSLTVPIVVAADRALAVTTLLNHYPDLNLVISDDGWQHLAMARSAVIEVIDAEKGYGNGLCLPAGPLREDVTGTAADLTLYQGGDVTLAPTHWYHIASQTYYPLAEKLPDFTHPNRSVMALAGIGNPDRFFNTLAGLDIHVSASFALADHQAIPAELLNNQGEFSAIIMTMKDAMRCPTSIADHYWALAVTTQFTPQTEEKLTHLVKSILNH